MGFNLNGQTELIIHFKWKENHKKLNALNSMKIASYFVVFLMINLSAFPQAFGPYKKMIDPSIDVPAKPWCYLAKSTTVIGVPHQSGYTSGTPETAIYTYGAVTQVTYDGSLFTNNAELGFFYGKNDMPLMARQKTFYKVGFLSLNIRGITIKSGTILKCLLPWWMVMMK